MIAAASRPENAPESDADAKNVATLVGQKLNMPEDAGELHNKPDLQSLSRIEERHIKYKTGEKTA
jgi:hypothetical protein